MLIIGVNQENNSISHGHFDIDIDVDSPRKIHDMLSKKTNGSKFNSITCIEDDVVLASYYDQDDYDLSVEEEVSDLNDEDADPDTLHEEDDDAEDEDNDVG